MDHIDASFVTKPLYFFRERVWSERKQRFEVQATAWFLKERDKTRRQSEEDMYYQKKRRVSAFE
jgi:hypothetical protein